MYKLIPVLFLALMMTSCKHTVIQLKSTSPDGKTVLTVDADKSSALDPYKVVMHVKSGDIPDGSLQFEVVAGELNDSNVKFDWADSRNFTIRFVQRDGDTKTFSLRVSDTNAILEPVSIN